VNNGLRWTNDLLALLLELGALAALGYWGFTVGENWPLTLLLGLGAPVAAAVVWGLFAAPRATFRVPLAVVLVVKTLVFGAATAALYARGHRTFAIVFAVLVAINTVMVTIDRAGRGQRVG
jgi:Protein of unknown function (DUF2568)